MYPFLLQDWTTIQAGSSASITQTEPFWLDTSGYLDLVTFMEVRQVSAGGGGSVYMAYQTSPTKDENLFLAMNDITSSSATAMAVGLQVAVLLRDLALCPLSHWLRWQISTAAGATSYEATFRIWVAASQPGGIADLAQQDPSAVNMQFEGTAWTEGPTSPATTGSPNPPMTKLPTQQGTLEHPFDIKSVTSTGQTAYPQRRPLIPLPTRTGVQRPSHQTTVGGPSFDNSRLPAPYLSPGIKVIK